MREHLQVVPRERPAQWQQQRHEGGGDEERKPKLHRDVFVRASIVEKTLKKRRSNIVYIYIYTYIYK